MKKYISALAMCAVLIAAAGCNAAPAATTTAAATEKAATAAEETTTEETAADAPETEAQPEETAESSEGKTVVQSFPNGVTFYAEDASDSTEWSMKFDTALIRRSAGNYEDSVKNPDLFDVDSYSYSGEDFIPDDYFLVKDGEKTGNVTVVEPSLTFMYYTDENNNPQYEVMMNSFKIAEPITLTGSLRFYADEQYAISSGDIQFIPDSSYAGLPTSALCSSYGGYGSAATIDFFNDNDGNNLGGNAICTDAPRFRLGNLFEDYADFSDLNSIITNTGAPLSAEVEITLSDVCIEHTGQFGSRAYAKIQSVKSIN